MLVHAGVKNIQLSFARYRSKAQGLNIRMESQKNTYAIDMKPKDLISDENHFYVWCLIGADDKPHFLVMSVQDFMDTMGDSIKGISFFKDQDRQHFSAKDFGKWYKFLNRFDKLE